MSLLDSVLGSVLGGNSNSGNSSLQGALLQAVISQMLGGGQQGGSGGALGNIVGSMLGGGNQAGGGALGNILGSVLGGGNQAGGGALGNILGSVLGGGQQTGAAGGLGGLLGGLLGGGAQVQQQAGTQIAGGLGNLTDMLSQFGLGEQVKSWVGTGEDLPVTAEQIQNSLGQNGTLGQIASQAGVSETDAAGGLAELLPGLINKLTPNGQVDAGDITSILGSLLGGNKQ